MVLRCLGSVSGWLLGAWVSFSSLCSHGSGGSHGAGDVRVGGQAQNTPTAALFSVGIGTSTPTSTYTRRFNTISRMHCLKNCHLHTRTRSEYKSFVDSFHPKPYYSPPRISSCVIITVSCQQRQWRCHMHTRTRSEYKSFVHSVYIRNPITVHPVCQNVSLLLFDAKTNSGDVICIQGRDLSTNHLLILFIQNPITVRPACQNVL